MNIAQSTQETLGLMKNSLAKNVTVSTGLSAYDLQAPAKNLYPIITPLRNSLPRVGRLNPGDAARWRTITSITGSGYDAMGWVPEGQRTASMSYSAQLQVAPYLTLGEEDTVTFEAEAAAEGYEDLNATATLRLLQKTMRKEETALLGGNTSLALGTPAAPTLSVSGSGATLPTLTYSVIVVALSFEGYRNSSVSGGVATTKMITGNDGNTYTLNGGSSMRSANATQMVTLGQTLNATGAGRHRRRRLRLVRRRSRGRRPCRPSPRSTARPSARRYRRAAGRDRRRRRQFAQSDARLRRPADGRLQPREQRLCPDARHGHGGNRLVPYRLGPRFGRRDRQYAGADVEHLSALADGALRQRTGAEEHHQQVPDQRLRSADPLQRRGRSAATADHMASRPRAWFAGITTRSASTAASNPVQGASRPSAGHDPGACERLPVWYQSNQTPNVAEVLTRRDYYRVDWPLRTRRREFGVYAEETLAVYAPFGIGILTNIGNG